MPIVLTQNIWGGAPFWGLRRRWLARRFARLHPDIIGLQEVHAGTPGGDSSQAHELADLVGGYQTIFAPGRIDPSGRCEGVAILSRHTIRESSVKMLSQDRHDALDRFGPRIVLRAVVELAEGPIDVFVTHLSLSASARARTIRELLAFALEERSRSSNQGAMLLGDLNAEPDEPSLAMLAAGEAWDDVWSRAGSPGRGGTFPSIAPLRRIDYILVHPRARWQVDRCLRQPLSGSDHRGVAAWLSLNCQAMSRARDVP